MFDGNTTWTVGRVLSNLVGTETEAILYAGPHSHRGIVRGVGEYLVTLQNGPDLIAVSLPEITSFHVLGGARGIGGGSWVIEEDRVEEPVPAEPAFVASEPVGPTWFHPPEPTAAERVAAERAQEHAKAQEWARRIVDEVDHRR